MTALESQAPTAEQVLSKVILNVADDLGLTGQELAKVLGVHRSKISRLKQSLDLSPSSKEGEIALLLIRIARGLFGLVGQDKHWVEHFMRTHNQLTQGVPAQQVQTVQGLVTVLHVVDSLRGKN